MRTASKLSRCQRIEGCCGSSDRIAENWCLSENPGRLLFKFILNEDRKQDEEKHAIGGLLRVLRQN